jgi:hypothetical protein
VQRRYGVQKNCDDIRQFKKEVAELHKSIIQQFNTINKAHPQLKLDIDPTPRIFYWGCDESIEAARGVTS